MTPETRNAPANGAATFNLFVGMNGWRNCHRSSRFRREDSETWPPEKVFDVRWAATVVEHALSRLGEECERKGRRRIFDALSSCLSAEREDVSYASFSKTLGIPETAVKRLVHQLRKRYRSLLREEVAETVEKAQDVDDELRYLCAVLTTTVT